MVVTADKGLAGSYNHNILKIAEEELAKHPKRQLYVLGEDGELVFFAVNRDEDNKQKVSLQLSDFEVDSVIER